MHACDWVFDADSSIYEITFFEANHQAVDEYMKVFEEVIRRYAIGDLHYPRMLYDITPAGMFSIRYAAEQSRRILKAYNVDPPAVLAYIAEGETAEQLIHNITQQTGESKIIRRVFSANQYHEAVRWLEQTHFAEF